MSLFGAFDISASGMRTFRTWMDSIADNLTNTRSTARPDEEQFQAKVVIAEAKEGGGVQVREIDQRDDAPNFEYDPTHPFADPATGLVKFASVDMGREMTHLVAAQRGYQASLQTVQYARDAYQAALRLGRG